MIYFIHNHKSFTLFPIARWQCTSSLCRLESPSFRKSRLFTCQFYRYCSLALVIIFRSILAFIFIYIFFFIFVGAHEQSTWLIALLLLLLLCISVSDRFVWIREKKESENIKRNMDNQIGSERERERNNNNNLETLKANKKTIGRKPIFFFFSYIKLSSKH